jgi:hypothetical protein
MHTKILHRVMDIPVLREVVGAASGCAIALALYGVFEFVRATIGGGMSFDVVAPFHAAAGAVTAHGTVSLGLSSTLALAGACAFLHRRLLSSGMSADSL